MNDQKGTEFQGQWLEDLEKYLRALKDDVLVPADRPYWISVLRRELEEVRDRINSVGLYPANMPRVKELLASLEEVEREQATRPG